MKQDLTKTYKEYYTAAKEPEIKMLDAARYVAMVGKGDPSGPAFAKDVEALYSVAYAVKFMCKEEGADFVVAKLEGQWWYDEARYAGLGIVDAPGKVPRDEWSYRLLIRMPGAVTEQMMSTAKGTVIRKKGIARVQDVDLFTIPARKVVQMMHIGSFDTELISLRKMMDLMQEEGLERDGSHHEVYLSDMRKVEPAKLRTILREPVR